jgi:hypothetical protein
MGVPMMDDTRLGIGADGDQETIRLLEAKLAEAKREASNVKLVAQDAIVAAEAREKALEAKLAEATRARDAAERDKAINCDAADRHFRRVVAAEAREKALREAAWGLLNNVTFIRADHTGYEGRLSDLHVAYLASSAALASTEPQR